MPRFLRLLLDDENRVHMGWRALAFFGLYGVAVILLEFPASVLQLLLQKGASGFDFRLGIVIDCLGVLLATWACTALEGVPLSSIGLRLKRPWFRDFSWGLLAGGCLMAITAASILLLGGFHWTRNPGGSLRGVLAGIPFFLLVAVKEEALFRGYPFQRLLANLGPWPTQILISALFVIFHMHNPGMSGTTRLWAGLNIGLASLLMGLAYLRTKSLALPIGLHLGWNWAQGNLMGFGVSGTSTAQGWWTPVFSNKPLWLKGGPFGLEASVPCAVVCAAAILALLLWKPKSDAPESPERQP